MGAVYALFSSGLTLIWGMMNVINFAHGDLVMIGMYIAFWTYVLLSGGPAVFGPLAAILLFMFGVLVYFALIRHVIDGPIISQILATFGLAGGGGPSSGTPIRVNSSRRPALRRAVARTSSARGSLGGLAASVLAISPASAGDGDGSGTAAKRRCNASASTPRQRSSGSALVPVEGRVSGTRLGAGAPSGGGEGKSARGGADGLTSPGSGAAAPGSGGSSLRSTS